MSIRLNIAAIVVAVLVMSGVWLAANQSHRAPISELDDLYASPLCLSANGLPHTGSPTVARGWARTASVKLARAKVLFHGTEAIGLYDVYDGVPTPINFLRAGTHRWQPADDLATLAWVARACRSLTPAKRMP